MFNVATNLENKDTLSQYTTIFSGKCFQLRDVDGHEWLLEVSCFIPDRTSIGEANTT